jgi:Iron-containing redox enzyme
MPALNSRNGSAITLEVIDIKDAERFVHDARGCFLAHLPSPEQLTVEKRRAILARYTAVLEGNFIYWMTGAYLSAKTEEARSIILDNLREEIGDCHPEMMRRFALAAQAAPNDADAAVVFHDLTAVRLFVGHMESVPVVLMMAFFEGLLQKFMPYLADLAARQGSEETEYTDVHGVCDIAHTEGLFRALDAEAALSPLNPGADPYEGVNLLRKLLETIVHGTELTARPAVFH